ncbi:MAG: flagellar assembly protein FliW [Acidimicrobiales bacterium]
MSLAGTSSLPRAGTAPGSVGISGLYFAGGIPGFPAARHFSLRRWGPEPASPFWILDCQEVVGLRFVAVGPGVFFPWYRPSFGADVYRAVDAAGPDELVLLVILTLRARPEDTTANLLGPVVINARTGQAVQAVLSGTDYGPQVPLRPRS